VTKSGGHACPADSRLSLDSLIKQDDHQKNLIRFLSSRWGVDIRTLGVLLLLAWLRAYRQFAVSELADEKVKP